MSHTPANLYDRHVYQSNYWDARTGLPLRAGVPLREILISEFWRLFFGPLLDHLVRGWIESAEVPPTPFDGHHYFAMPRIMWPYICGRA